ncbi:MAG: FAD-linked oxidase C-terminal domain-containing protein [Caldilineaceae bacterium]
MALEITLRLLPKPETYRTVLASYGSLQAAGDAVARVVESGLLPGAMEIMDSLAIEAAEAAVNAGYPDAKALLIVELEGERVQVDAEFAHLLQVIEASDATEVRIAQDDADRTDLEGAQRRLFGGGTPQPRLYCAGWGGAAQPHWAKHWPASALSKQYNLRVANVFHAGDGNLHPLILYNGSEAGALERAERLAGEILEMCIAMGGSITGEHGVGVEKRAYMDSMFSETDLAVMNEIRQALDPLELANRGKMLPQGEAPALVMHGAHPLEKQGIISRE